MLKVSLKLIKEILSPDWDFLIFNFSSFQIELKSKSQNFKVNNNIRFQKSNDEKIKVASPF